MSEIPKTYNNQRIEFLDALKGFTIFCVTWGHALQFLRNGYDYFHNPAFEFIYSFHMALFFMVSGFFFRSSLRLNLKDFLYKRSVQLLLPCVVWSVIYCIINQHEELKTIFSLNNFWFLRELFISYFIVYVSLKLLKKDWLACLLSIGFVLIVPLSGAQKSFFPMFWAGIYLKNNYQYISKYAKQIRIISGIIFAVCLLFWDGNYTMYVTYFPKIIQIKPFDLNFTNIDIALFRLLIGLCGSLFWFMLFEKIYKNNKFFGYLGKIGANTLAIYVLQPLIWDNGIVSFPTMNNWIYTLIVTPLISLGVLGVSMIIIKIVRKNKHAELLLFGKK